MAFHTYIIGPNPKRWAGNHNPGITYGRVVYSADSATRPDVDHEIAVYADEHYLVSLGYANVDCLFGDDMPSLADSPVVTLPARATLSRAYSAAFVALGVDADLPVWRLVEQGVDVDLLMDLAKVIEERLSA